MLSGVAARLVVIVPSRERPANVKRLRDAWIATGATATLIVALDDDDPLLDEYARIVAPWLSWWIRPRKRLAGILNDVAVAYAPNYEYIAFLGDDHVPRTHGWDARFCECLSAGAGICYGNDLIQGELMPTAVAMTSSIINTLGYMCPPGLEHLNLDIVWRDWGEGMQRITYLPDVIVEHVHPVSGKAEWDDGYRANNSYDQVSRDGDAYHQYRDQHLEADLTKLRGLL